MGSYLLEVIQTGGAQGKVTALDTATAMKVGALIRVRCVSSSVEGKPPFLKVSSPVP